MKTPMRLLLAGLAAALALSTSPEAGAQTRGQNAYNALFQATATGDSPRNAYLLAYLATVIYPENLAQVTGVPRAEQASVAAGWHCDRARFAADFDAHVRPLVKPAPVTSAPGLGVPAAVRDARVATYATRIENRMEGAVGLRPGVAAGGRAEHPARPAPAPVEAPRFAFVTGVDRAFRDPEAMVISTPNAVFVVFRGTDRVCDAVTLPGYMNAEWITTSLSVALDDPDGAPGRAIRGRVHSGPWRALRATAVDGAGTVLPGRPAFRDRLAQVIEEFGGREKPIWIAGHSLGASFARLFAARLHAENGITAQGVHAFAAGAVGDADFAAWMRARWPGARLLNFDFADDPITMLPPPPLLPGVTEPFDWRRPGLRVHHADIGETIFDMPRRPPGFVAASLAGSLVGGLLGGSTGCFHHPHWYARAAFERLSTADRERMPAPPPLPTAASEACDDRMAALGRDDGVAQPRLSPEVLAGNLDGTIARNRNVRLRRAAGGDERLAVGRDCFDRNGCEVTLEAVPANETRARFRLEHRFGRGYLLRFGARFVEADVNPFTAAEGKVQVWDANLAGMGNGANQLWWLDPLGGDRFVLVNADMSPLNPDAARALTTECNADGCGVRLRPAGGAQLSSQAWRVE
jgi:hypothetical protein